MAIGRTSIANLKNPSFLSVYLKDKVSTAVSTRIYIDCCIAYAKDYNAMWLKKLFKAEKEQSKQVKEEGMEQEDTVKQSKVFTVSQQEVDLRYSNLKIINTKSLHLPQQALHFIESVFFSEQQILQGRTKHCDSFTILQQVILTDRQMLIIPDLLSSANKRTSNPTGVLHIFYGMIEKVEALPLKKETPKLQFTLKDNRVLLIQSKLADKLQQIEQIIRQFGFPNGVNKFYAFKYGKVPKKQDGWRIYNFHREMERQGVLELTFDPNSHASPLPSHIYQIIDNRDFAVSPTYPRQLVIPLGLSLAEVVACSRFRTKQRLPILTFFYQYLPSKYVSLFRCSQIKSGILSARCEADEKIIRQIGVASLTASNSPASSRPACKVYDARGFYAALGNKLSGKGFEHAQTYDCQVQFLNIPNIHAVRDSYNKVRSYSPQRQFLQVLGESGWIDYLFLILSGAKSMVKTMQQGTNVVVHCSDGWDRTTQLSALTQLLLDSYYRTLQGFAVLVEKDWRECGHKFRQRSGQHNPKEYRQSQKSPIFLQFLDCIIQIMSQFPLSFQFNSKMLCFLGEAYQSTTYGTFLTNNLKQSSQLQIQSKSISVWSDILEHRAEYLNPFYSADGPKVLQLSVDSKDFTVWSEFLQETMSAKEKQWSVLKRQVEINANLKDNIDNYEREIEKMKARLNQ